MASSFPTLAVVDTNVPLVASKKHQVSLKCVHSCVHALDDIMNKGVLFIDSNWLIIEEYKKKLSISGEPGVGDRFLRWVITHKDNPKKCIQVKITPTNHNNCDFEEFPPDFELQNFDPSDRKFIAVALSHQDNPTVLQATDSKWWKVREILLRNKVKVCFLCPDDIKEMHNKKKKEENE